MARMLWVAGLVFFIGVGATYIFDYLGYNEDLKAQVLPDTHWGKKISGGKVDTSIRPFTIDVSQKVIDDLNSRLENRKELVQSLEGTAWEYGIPAKIVDNVASYWRKNYDWQARQQQLNKYPQFVTNIQGLDIHFYHVKPQQPKARNVKVIPLLLVHGWPGSVVEFQKIIPMLTTPRDNRNFVFEVVIPSLPGYGFSQAAVRPGMGPAQIGVVFKNLMSRLGFEKFYTQGGDWGSAITSIMASMYPDRVIGAHLNMCIVLNPKAMIYQLIGSVFPSFVVESEHASKMYPLNHHFSYLMRESGYMHLQATKPDTIGHALTESPTALAAYILEKFSTWTNPEYMKRSDGGLVEKFKMDELIDNLMMYWVTNSITTSMRLYSESFSIKYRTAKWDEVPVKVPTACAAFPNELMYMSEKLLKHRYHNLIQYNHMSRGGHFAAFEEPHILSDDIWTFVNKVEN